MRIAGWMVFLSIMAAVSVAPAADFDRDINLCQSAGNNLSYDTELPVVRVSDGQGNFGLLGAILDGTPEWQITTAAEGWYDAAVAAIMRQVPVAACYAPGTPPEVMALYNRYMQVGPGPLAYFLSGRWSGGQGNPRNLTWSFVPDGTLILAAIPGEVTLPSEIFSRMDTLFFEDTALWTGLFEQSFARWGELTGLSFTRVTVPGQLWDDGAAWGSSGSAGLRGDIRISMKNIDGGSRVLAYNYFPSNGDMVLDRSENWGSGFNNWRFLRNVIMHEHGHGLGEFHVCSSNTRQLMEPFISTSFDGPQHDDMRGAQRHYGDPFEPDNNAASATDLGTLTAASPLTTPPVPPPNIGSNPANSALMSIDAPNEQDWFLFSVDETTSILTVSAIPRGFSYDSSPQLANGNCSSGNSVNSEAAANLDIELYDSDGVTLLASAAASGAGTTETLSNFDLTGPADYFVRIFASGSVGTTQLYDVNLSIELPGACCLADGSCVLTRAALCSGQPGFYQGDGTPCPPDPACAPVDTIMTCELSSSTGISGGSVLLELFVEEVVDLAAFQATIQITKTSGTGTVTVPCPDGARINEKICLSTDTFLPTGDTCDGGDPCPVADPPNICIDRTDYVFADLDAFIAVNCETPEVAASTNNSSVTVTGERKYFGDFLLEVSTDAEAGSTFEIGFVQSFTASFLNSATAARILTRFGAPCVLTISDSSTFDKNRYVSFKPTEPGEVAYKLDMVSSLFHPTAIVSGWVGVPDGNGIASLVPDPVTRAWIEPVVSITGCEIAPVAEFELRASPDDGQSFFPPISVRTIPQPGGGKFWGDTCGSFDGTEWSAPQGITNIDDAVCVIKTFQEVESAPEVPRTDVEPQEPNRVVNFNDVLFVLFAFKGEPYPFGCPDDPCQDNVANPCP